MNECQQSMVWPTTCAETHQSITFIGKSENQENTQTYQTRDIPLLWATICTVLIVTPIPPLSDSLLQNSSHNWFLTNGCEKYWALVVTTSGHSRSLLVAVNDDQPLADWLISQCQWMLWFGSGLDSKQFNNLSAVKSITITWIPGHFWTSDSNRIPKNKIQTLWGESAPNPIHVTHCDTIGSLHSHRWPFGRSVITRSAKAVTRILHSLRFHRILVMLFIVCQSLQQSDKKASIGSVVSERNAVQTSVIAMQWPKRQNKWIFQWNANNEPIDGQSDSAVLRAMQ